MSATAVASNVRRRAGIAVALVALVFGSIAAGVLGALSKASETTSPTVVSDIPPAYLAAYRASSTRFRLGDDGCLSWRPSERSSRITDGRARRACAAARTSTVAA